MFKKYDAYTEATKYAQVNRNQEEGKWTIGYIVINLFSLMILTLIGYFMWSSLLDKNTDPIYKTKVMGVTHTIDENEELMSALNVVKVENIDILSKSKAIKKELSTIISNSELNNKTVYGTLIEQKRLEERVLAELKTIN